ncbi:hypothetical protein ACOMCU_00955 [Lysinibacillus sp. UGB7]|uniref:hypothetical protein n=1 Tax=Lysinibacillus sp. UGB7 TaxID=3411039 RepID=UPI003B7A77FF
MIPKYVMKDAERYVETGDEQYAKKIKKWLELSGYSFSQIEGSDSVINRLKTVTDISNPELEKAFEY